MSKLSALLEQVRCASMVWLLILGSFSTGCACEKFKLVSDNQQLMKDRRIVAEVTCMSTSDREYVSFRDHYFRLFPMMPRYRQTSVFRINRILKGDLQKPIVTLTDAEDLDEPYWAFAFIFEANKDYTVGFDRVVNNRMKKFTVCGQRKEPESPVSGTEAK